MAIINDKPKTDLCTSDFYYDLPEELIAQHPADVRDSSRLMVLHRENKTIEHKIFSDIIDYLNPGDTLVVNDSKVIPARLFGNKVGKREPSWSERAGQPERKRGSSSLCHSPFWMVVL